MRLAVIAALLLTGACTDERASRRALDAHGFSEIRFTGYEWFSCNKDTFSTGFRAKNARGDAVEGVVCCGWLKSYTVRF